MVFLGFLLVMVAIAAGAGVVLDNTGSTRLVVLGETVPGVTEDWQVFLAGAAVSIVFFVGMMLVYTGIANRFRDRRDLRDLREEREESRSSLEREKRRLQQELAHARQQRRPAPAGQAPAGQAPPGRAPSGRAPSGPTQTGPMPTQTGPVPGPTQTGPVRAGAAPAGGGLPRRPRGAAPAGVQAPPAPSRSQVSPRSPFFDRSE